jgi:transposase
MKARFKEYERGQQYFINLNLDEIRKNSPLAAAIDDYIEAYIDIESFEQNANNEESGQAAENPKIILKLLFYCYANECYSSRDIESRSRYDQNAIYLCGNRSIDHSTICRFIIKSKEQIYEIFTKMVYVLFTMGYIDKEFTAIDGTKIKANASKEFTGNINEFHKKKKHIEKKIEKILNETEKTSEKELKKIDKLERNKEKVENFLNELEKDKTRKDERVNVTDPDARLMKDNGIVYLGYNCQTAADGKNHFIVGSKVSNNASDRNQLLPMIEEIKDAFGEDNTKQKITADADYFSSKNIIYAEENNIDLYLPEGRGEGGEKKKRKAKGIISRDCVIHEENGKKCLECPGEHTSVAEKKIDSRGRAFYEFSVPASVCKSCNHLSNCNKNVSKSRRFIVMADYYDSFLLRKKMHEKLASKNGKAVYHKRSCIIEHIFGEIKEYRNFRKFYHRRLDTVNTIWSMMCIAYNFRKLAKLHYA